MRMFAYEYGDPLAGFSRQWSSNYFLFNTVIMTPTEVSCLLASMLNIMLHQRILMLGILRRAGMATMGQAQDTQLPLPSVDLGATGIRFCDEGVCYADCNHGYGERDAVRHGECFSVMLSPSEMILSIRSEPS